MSPITIQKLDHTGKLKYQYPGEVVERTPTSVCVVAPFVGRESVDLGCVVLRRGDTFTEWHYSDRWYNIFQVNAVEDGHLKGWYCNVTRPATITARQVSADDLALDVYVMPDGEIHLLDEDEFAALNLSADEQAAAWRAVDALRQAAADRIPPFQLIGS